MRLANYHIITRWRVHQSDLRRQALQLRSEVCQLIITHDRGSCLGVILVAQRSAWAYERGLLDVPLDGVGAPSSDQQDRVGVTTPCASNPKGVAPESLHLFPCRANSGGLRSSQVDDAADGLDGVRLRPSPEGFDPSSGRSWPAA